MSGDGCLHGYLCRFFISDLTDHDDIRVLAEYGTKG